MQFFFFFNLILFIFSTMTGERRTYIEMAEMHVIVLYFMLRDFRISVLISLISLGPRL